MAPKGGNAKKESGRAKKAENESKKKEAAAAEAVSTGIRVIIHPADLTHHRLGT